MSSSEPAPASPKRIREGRAVVLLAFAVLAAGSLQLARAGYSVDEEFTVFAVRGIQSHGVPLLPSGLLYDRGIAYSYVSWLAAAITGSELPAFRAISLISAAAIVILTAVLIGRIGANGSAILGALLVAMAVPFWATATSGRFYAPFLALYLATLISMRSAFALTAVLALFCRLTHELAFTLAIVPVVGWLFERERRRHWVRVAFAIGAGLVAGQLLLFGLHYLAPTSGGTMVRRFFLWQVLNLFERPGDRQFLIPVILMVLAWIVAPKRAGVVAVIAMSLAAMILTYSVARASNTAPLTCELVQAVLVEGSRYPLDMFWHIAAATPWTLLLACTGLVGRAGGLGGKWSPGERALHLLWIGWVLWFGVIDSGITTNYLLLPTTFMLMAIAVDAWAILMTDGVPARRFFSAPSRPAIAAVIAIALQVGFDQWRGAGSMLARLDAARPTIVADGIADIRTGLQPADRVVCTDELGCLMVIGRIDRWLALDDYVRERFLVRRGDAPAAGVYTGVPAVFRPTEIFDSNADGTLPDRVLIVDIFKEYPIGNSRSWLPKAIEETGLRVEPLLETPQLRILQVSTQEAHARLR
ncbi:MAG TPA: hypothetical protein VF491_17875 [Vicinamibacterales bacterium]